MTLSQIVFRAQGVAVSSFESFQNGLRDKLRQPVATLARKFFSDGG
jgi:hypothetical protein